MADRIFRVQVPQACKHCGHDSGFTKDITVKSGILVQALSQPNATVNEQMAGQVIKQLLSELPVYDRT